MDLFYAYLCLEGVDGDPPVLGRFDNEDVYLSLPDSVDIHDLRFYLRQIY